MTRSVEGQQAPEGARRRPQPLEEGGVDGPVGEPSLGPALVVDGREDVSLGPHRAELEEDAFAAAQVEQEIVDESDTTRR